MAQRRDRGFLPHNMDGPGRDDEDVVDAEALVGDNIWLDEDELLEWAEEDDELVIEVELFDEDELDDTEA